MGLYHHERQALHLFRAAIADAPGSADISVVCASLCNGRGAVEAMHNVVTLHFLTLKAFVQSVSRQTIENGRAVIHVRAQNNTAQEAGGGVALVGSRDATLTISGTTFSSNQVRPASDLGHTRLHWHAAQGLRFTMYVWWSGYDTMAHTGCKTMLPLASHHSLRQLVNARPGVVSLHFCDVAGG